MIDSSATNLGSELGSSTAGEQPIDTAPKDRPILAWCDHEADPYYDGQTSDGRTRVTLYVAHGEGLAYAPTGWHIVEWGGGYDESTWEYPNQASLPDWWFVAGSEFEVAANPTHWMDLPPARAASSPSETPTSNADLPKNL